jgi:uncharacterized membrane protein
MVEEIFKQWTLILSVAVEACAALLIGLASARTIFAAIRYFFRRKGKPGDLEEMRLDLGRWLALALEFELAADILRTAVAPTWEEIGKLGAIVVLRTALNFFLQREIEHVSERRKNEEKGEGYHGISD